MGTASTTVRIVFARYETHAPIRAILREARDRAECVATGQRTAQDEMHRAVERLTKKVESK